MTKAIRNQYAQLGVDNYYKTNADVYQNPHKAIITSLISQSLDRIDYGESVYDLCCGNGLVTKLLDRNIRSIKGIDPYMATLITTCTTTCHYHPKQKTKHHSILGNDKRNRSRSCSIANL